MITYMLVGCVLYAWSSAICLNRGGMAGIALGILFGSVAMLMAYGIVSVVK